MKADKTVRGGVVAIDLGSNTCRAIEYDCVSGRFGRECERIVKTADRMHETGLISDEAVERIIAALKEADALFDLANRRCRAVTTAAMRMASNRAEVLERIETITGIRFEVIDADAEAAYTLQAVRARLSTLGRDNRSLAMVDIGGGSTEVVFYQNGERVSHSFPIGIVTIAQQCSGPDAVRRLLEERLFEVRQFVRDYYAVHGRVDTFVTTAGTPTTIAAFLQGMTYRSYDPARINGFELTREECEHALHDLLRLDEKTRSIYVGVGRETLIVAGVVIVEAFYDVLGFERSVVIDDGVREGVAIDACSQSDFNH